MRYGDGRGAIVWAPCSCKNTFGCDVGMANEWAGALTAAIDRLEEVGVSVEPVNEQTADGSQRLRDTVRVTAARRLEAEQADAMIGPKIKGSDQASGRSMLAEIDRTHTVRFENLNLADTAGVEVICGYRNRPAFGM